MAKKRADHSSTSGQGGFGSSLADALRSKGLAAQSSDSAPRDEGAPPAADHPVGADLGAVELIARCEKIHLQMEKKGRGGKTITRMQGTASLSAKERKRLARVVGKALGCGSSVEGNDIIVQGNQKERLETWLIEIRR
jgi:translation initiation factor 1